MKFSPTAVALLATLFATCVPLVESLSCTFLQLVIDESGSMETEQEFLRLEAMPAVIEDLELNFGQTVFVCSWGYAFTDRGKVPLSGRSLGCSKGFDNNDYDFKTNGGTEDGYAAIKAAHDFATGLDQIDGTPLSSCDSINRYMIFASDEDRDEEFTNVSFDSTKQLLQNFGWTLHAILNNPINGGAGVGAVEQSSNLWTVYSEDPAPVTGGSRYIQTQVNLDPVGRGPGKPDYSPLAFATDGAVWDLNKLRKGGLATAAFTEAFIEITTEIITEPIAPSSSPTDVPTGKPTFSPAPTGTFSPTSPTDQPTGAPSRNPITAPPTGEPDLCSTAFVLPCIKDTSEGVFRGVLRILMERVLSAQELTLVIPPLADELNSVQIQKAVQAILCDLSKDPTSFNPGEAAVKVFSALLRGVNLVDLGNVANKAIRENIDVSFDRGLTLLFDLGTAFAEGIDPNEVAGDVFNVLVQAFNDALSFCLGINLPPVPSPPPPPKPSKGSKDDEEDGGWGWCFSGHSTVNVEGKGTTRMDQLKIGDSVHMANGSYSPVYSFGHRERNKKTEYLQIKADIDKHHHPLEISSNHLLYKHNLQTKKKEAVPAGNINVGDWIVSDNGSSVQVSSIAKIIRYGAYSPLTVSGNLLVNDVLASNYVSRLWVQDWLSGQTLHYLQHGGALPRRVYCAVAGCHDETYDEETGFSPWVMFWYRIEQWQLGLHPMLQALFLMVLVVPATFVVIVGMLLMVPTSTAVTHLLVCLAGYYIWKKAHGKPGSGFNKELKADSKH